MICSGAGNRTIGRHARALAVACAALALLSQFVLAGWAAQAHGRFAEKAGIMSLLGDQHVICAHHAHPSSPDRNPQKDCDDCPICHGLRLTAWFTPPDVVLLPIRLSRHVAPPMVESVALAPSILLRRAQPRGPPAVA